ncbi:MAG: transketolase C-terminal domain-containing protein, partial [Nitrososphaerota archaeon]
IGHMMENVEIPDLSSIKIVDRKKPLKLDDSQFFLSEDIAPMPTLGSGYMLHITGSTHNEKGIRNVYDPTYVNNLIYKIYAKIHKHIDDIVKIETRYLDDSKILLLSYGSVARSALHAVKLARRIGLKVGYVRLITLWPFPEKIISNIINRVEKIIVLENNMGQIVNEVKRVSHKDIEVKFLPPDILGTIHDPLYIMNNLRKFIGE